MDSKVFSKTLLILLAAFLAGGCSEFGAFDMTEAQLNGAADGGSESSDPGSFPDDPWAASSASSRRRIIIDNSAQSETLSAFQLMVRLDGSRIDYSETDGSDLQFFSAGNGSELYYEVESWNETGSSVVWVRVPAIWGNSNLNYIWSGVTSSHQDASSVWSEYEGVYHLSESGSTTVADSSSKGRDGTVTSFASVEGAEGRIGAGVRLGSTGGYIDIPDYASSFGPEESIE